MKSRALLLCPLAYSPAGRNFLSWFLKKRPRQAVMDREDLYQWVPMAVSNGHPSVWTKAKVTVQEAIVLESETSKELKSEYPKEVS